MRLPNIDTSLQALILMEHIHHLKGIYRIILDSSLGICILAYHYISDNPFQLKVTWKYIDSTVK